jgi:hypothetical protein
VVKKMALLADNKNGNLNMDEQVRTNYYCYFLLCKECFWCASSVNLGISNRIVKCPSCNKAYVKLMPIFDNETNRIDYGEKSRFTTDEFGIKYTQKNTMVV